MTADPSEPTFPTYHPIEPPAQSTAAGDDGDRVDAADTKSRNAESRIQEVTPAAAPPEPDEPDDWSVQPSEPIDAAEFARRFPKTAAVFQSGVVKGQHFGGQFSIWHRGQRTDAAVGVTGPAGDEPLDALDLLCWRSAGKPITAVLLLHSMRDRKIDLEATVASVLPEFGKHGKERITFRHLLTHTSGMKSPVSGWPTMPAARIWDRICDAPLHDGVQPGERAAYDPVAGWMALGLACEELTRFSIERLVELTFDHRDGAAFLAKKGPEAIKALQESATFEDRLFIAESVGRLRPQWDTTKPDPRRLNLHEVDACTNASPGSSLHAYAADVAWFYNELLRALRDESELFDRDIVEPMTRRQRVDRFDEAFQHRVDFGLGVIVNSERYGQTVPYGFGPSASEHTFGHGGAQCAIGWADPEHDLAVAWALNGLCGEPRHNLRNRKLNAAIYEDLGLAG